MHEFTREQVDQAIAFVIHAGAEDRGQTVSYSRVWPPASQRRRSCTKAGKPKPSADS